MLIKNKKGFQMTFEVIVVIIILLVLLVFLLVFLTGQGGKITSLFEFTVGQTINQSAEAVR